MTLMTASKAPKSSPGDALLEVLFFGRVADCFGRSANVAIPSEGCPLSTIRQGLIGRTEGGEVLGAPGVRAAVDREMALSDAAWVRPGQEVAFFSPFSGG